MLSPWFFLFFFVLLSSSLKWISFPFYAVFRTTFSLYGERKVREIMALKELKFYCIDCILIWLKKFNRTFPIFILSKECFTGYSMIYLSQSFVIWHFNSMRLRCYCYINRIVSNKRIFMRWANFFLVWFAWFRSYILLIAFGIRISKSLQVKMQ